MSKKTAKFRASMLTDVGIVRDHNEDSGYVDPDNQFFVVADGMGGHAAGEVASAMAADTVRESLESSRDIIKNFVAEPSEAGRKKLIALLESAVRDAHQAVYERGVRESDKQGMGTTLDVLMIAGADAFVAHVGDSRTYLIRDGKAAQITTDHTVAEVLVIEGKLSVEEAATSPLRTILVNAIGVAEDVGVEMAHLRLKEEDILLLCSDGLHDYFPVDQEIADQLEEQAAKDALEKMVDLAKERGGHDNITGVVVEVLEVPDVPDVITSPEALEQTIDTADAVAAPATDSDGVPRAVGRDDTMPVDVDEVLAREQARKKTLKPGELSSPIKSGSAATGDDTEDLPAEGDDGDDDAQASGTKDVVVQDKDASPEADTLTSMDALNSPKKPKKPNNDLKTTVPIRPVKPREDK